MCEVLGMEKKRYYLSLQGLTIQLSWFVLLQNKLAQILWSQEKKAWLS